jgi:hypothetical protein
MVNKLQIPFLCRAMAGNAADDAAPREIFRGSSARAEPGRDTLHLQTDRRAHRARSRWGPLRRHNVFKVELGNVGTAISNRAYHATGIRLRKLPIRIEDVLEGKARGACITRA